jgi:glycosyltransferase involved in cell wall biosynthesis
MVDKVWVCSEQDRDRLRSLSGGRALADVIPNGVPRFELIPEQLVDQPEMANGKPTLLFIGHLNYPPNLEAARRLATQILPRLQSALGGAKLIIAGRSPHRSLADIAALPDVELIANPDDLAVLYRRAHLAIVPLISGGGTRLKILEAMAWGLPVVATRLAAEGLDLVDGVDIDFAETDDELAARAAALCADSGWLQARRLRARETVARRFGPQAISAAVRASLL